MYNVIFMGICATLALAAVDCSYLPAYIRQNASRNYLQTTGVVLRSEIKFATFSGPRHSQSSYPTAVVRYSYSVDGLAFESDCYRYLGTHPSANAAGIVNALQKGAPVTVFYNPQNIQDAVLSSGLNKTDRGFFYLIAAANLFLITLWAYLLFKFLKKP